MQPQLTLSAWWEEGGGKGRWRQPHTVPMASTNQACQLCLAVDSIKHSSLPAARLMLLQTSHSTHRDGPIGVEGHSQSMQMYAVLAAVLLLLRANTCRLVRDLGSRTAELLAARNGCTLSEDEAILACWAAAADVISTQAKSREPESLSAPQCRDWTCKVGVGPPSSRLAAVLQLDSNTTTAWQQLSQKSSYCPIYQQQVMLPGIQSHTSFTAGQHQHRQVRHASQPANSSGRKVSP